MPKSFAPSVMLNGKAYTPPGWVWVLSFALAGCEWAIPKVDTKEFRAMVRKDIVDRKCERWQAEIESCEHRIVALREELRIRNS